jgi:ABC-2 type transport system permease protein
MTATTLPARRLPRLGGFSTGMIALELRRMMRNRRTVILTFIMPAAFFLLFGTNSASRNQSAGDGNVTGYILISMAVYGAMLATTSGGAMVSIERAAGWSRQLRLTPLSPAAYIAVKLVALVFAAFGLFMGYLLPSENVMQILGPVLAVLSFAGGLFVPVGQLGHTFATIAKFTPVYGVGELARYPLVHDGNLWLAAANVIAWTALFSAGAMWRFRRDTARV